MFYQRQAKVIVGPTPIDSTDQFVVRTLSGWLRGLNSLSGWARSREVSKPWNRTLKSLYHFEIWQAARQQCCRDACQISERFKIPQALNSASILHDLTHVYVGICQWRTWTWDLTITRLTAWWIVAQGSFCTCAQPMRDNVTMQRSLSLAGHIHKMTPGNPEYFKAFVYFCSSSHRFLCYC